MCIVSMYEAKTNLSKYIEMLEKGEEKEIIVCRYDNKIAKITLYDESEYVDIVGAGKGILKKQDFELKKGFEDIPELFGY